MSRVSAPSSPVSQPVPRTPSPVGHFVPGTPPNLSAGVFVSPGARRVRQPVAAIDERGNLALHPCHRGSHCIRGQFVVGDLYSSAIFAALESSIADSYLFQNEQFVLELRLTIQEHSKFSSLRFGFSSGVSLPHSRFVLPADQKVICYEQEKVRGGAAVVRLPELATVQAAGTVKVVVGDDGFGKVLEMTLESGHYLPPDIKPGKVDQNRYLGRIVKSWKAFYGNCEQLLGATLKNIEEQVLGRVDEALINKLLRLDDPTFKAQPRKKCGLFQAILGPELDLGGGNREEGPISKRARRYSPVRSALFAPIGGQASVFSRRPRKSLLEMLADDEGISTQCNYPHL